MSTCIHAGNENSNLIQHCNDFHFIMIFESLHVATITDSLVLITGTQQKITLQTREEVYARVCICASLCVRVCVTARPFKVDQISILDCLLG